MSETNTNLPNPTSYSTFAEIHEFGSVVYGLAWLRANQRAVEAFTLCEVTPSSPKIRKALSLAVLRLMQNRSDPDPFGALQGERLRDAAGQESK